MSLCVLLLIGAANCVCVYVCVATLFHWKKKFQSSDNNNNNKNNKKTRTNESISFDLFVDLALNLVLLVSVMNNTYIHTHSGYIGTSVSSDLGLGTDLDTQLFV